MKIAIIGATGTVGAAVLKEALDRNHEVTAIARDLSQLENKKERLELEVTDVNDTEKLAKVLKDQEVVISAFNSGWTNPNIYEDYLQGSRSIQEAVKSAGVKRLIVVGGAGSLFVDKNTQLVDTPQFPKEILGGATAARDYLKELKAEQEIDWTFFSPAPPGICARRSCMDPMDFS